jgi:hypothetical protein
MQGFYNPFVMPKSLSVDGGRTAMLTTAGDFNVQDPQTGSYTLTLLPISINN